MDLYLCPSTSTCGFLFNHIECQQFGFQSFIDKLYEFYVIHKNYSLLELEYPDLGLLIKFKEGWSSSKRGGV